MTPNCPLLRWSLVVFHKDRSLEPLFKMYTPDLMKIIERHGLLPHLLPHIVSKRRYESLWSLFTQRNGRPCSLCSVHISTTLANLQWLCAAKHIKFKLATLMFCCLQCSPPRYLSSNFTRVADMQSRRSLRSSSTNDHIVRPTPLVTVLIVHFRSKSLSYGTVFSTNALHCRHNFLSGVNIKHFCLPLLSLTSAARQ